MTYTDKFFFLVQSTVLFFSAVRPERTPTGQSSGLRVYSYGPVRMRVHKRPPTLSRLGTRLQVPLCYPCDDIITRVRNPGSPIADARVHTAHTIFAEPASDSHGSKRPRLDSLNARRDETFCGNAAKHGLPRLVSRGKRSVAEFRHLCRRRTR